MDEISEDIKQAIIREHMAAVGAKGLARRVPVPHTCAHCGKAFEARPEAIYCSAICRVDANRAKRRSAGDAASTNGERPKRGWPKGLPRKAAKQ